ncbi:MAG: polyprenyl synthetase family protein [Ruminococcaceae bacterium]|nr:polyprenyl synthetase family protein [Oscillospiraceae bacterium]
MAKGLLKEDAALVEGLLDTLYRGGGRCDAVLDRSERYSLMAGGKRVRPALTLEFCRLFGGRPEDALPFAAAVEMIHTFSLIHDDLPCMDDDDLRRGRPTNHKVFGEAYALLAGDGLALDAFGMAASNERVTPEARAQAVLLLSRAAGSDGMVRGQVMDMFGEQNTLTYEELLALHAHKTGALIRVAAQLGCLAAGISMDSPKMAAAVGYAERIGLAFQVVDDVLDATSTPEALGKSVGGDAEHHKNTFLSFKSVAEAEAYADRLTAGAVEIISAYEGSERLSALALYLAVRKA